MPIKPRDLEREILAKTFLKRQRFPSGGRQEFYRL
jgi:hypothetical protein